MQQQIPTAKGEFEAIRPLGIGGCFGHVCLVRRLSDGAQFAIKEIDLNLLVSTKQQNEPPSSSTISGAAVILVELGRIETLMKQLDHEFLIKCFGSFLEDDVFHLVLEYCDCGSFQDALGEALAKNRPFSTVDVQKWARQLVSAVAYLHDKKLVHRAIFAKNTFLANNRETAKLGALGLTKRQKQTPALSPRSRHSSPPPSNPGSPMLPTSLSCLTGDMSNWEHCPPEVINGEIYSTQSDLWSLGVLFYQIANLKLPFFSENAQKLLDAIVKKDARPHNSWCCATLRAFIDGLLEKSPINRPTAAKLISSDPFLAMEITPSILLTRSLSNSYVQEASTIKISTGEYLRIWRSSEVPTMFKDSICTTLKKENVTVDMLMAMSDADVYLIFPQREIQRSVMAWRRDELRKTKSRLLTAIRNADLVEIVGALGSQAARSQLFVDGNIELFPRTIISTTEGDPPLHYASRHGQVDVVKFIMARYRTPIDAKNRHGDMAIHVAAVEGNVEVVKFFLEKNQHLIEARGKLGQTPLLRAASNGLAKMVLILIEKGANLVTKDESSDEETALHLAASFGNLPCCKIMLERDRTLIDLTNRHNETPIWNAIRKGHAELVEFLAEYVTDFESRDRLGRTLLMQAAADGNAKIVSLLLSKKADVRARSWMPIDVEGSPIHLAAFYGNVEIVEMFLASDNEQMKPLLRLANKNGDTALWRAAFNGQLKVVELLLPPDVSTGHRADIEARGQFGATPLIAAAARGHLSVVEFLLKRGANHLARDWEQSSTAFHLAAAYGHIEVVRHLLDNFADLLDKEDSAGLTPMAYATFRGKTDVVKFLAEHGARKCELAVHLA